VLWPLPWLPMLAVTCVTLWAYRAQPGTLETSHVAPLSSMAHTCAPSAPSATRVSSACIKGIVSDAKSASSTMPDVSFPPSTSSSRMLVASALRHSKHSGSVP
jgi:hypothetical protein